MKKVLMIAAAAAFVVGGMATTAHAGIEKQCESCHSFNKGENKTGPSLFGVFGRKAGTVEGFEYSDELKNSGLTWDEATLRKWIDNAPAVVPDTYMPEQKLTGKKADKMIEFLKKAK